MNKIKNNAKVLLKDADRLIIGGDDMNREQETNYLLHILNTMNSNLSKFNSDSEEYKELSGNIKSVEERIEHINKNLNISEV